MFDALVQEELKYYVYLLVNPSTDEPFYVGKGKGNRVFQHVQAALEDDEENLKFDIIREILSNGKQVRHVIVRHGLNEVTALELEAAFLDVFDYLPGMKGFICANQQGGINSIEKGLMTTDEIIRFYKAEPLDYIDSNCMIININRSYQQGKGKDAIYEATKEIWRINKQRTKTIRFVLSEYHGRIVEVFEVERWYSKERNYNKGSTHYGKKYLGYGFDGVVAPEDIRNRYINRSIAHHKKRGSASVIRYKLT